MAVSFSGIFDIINLFSNLKKARILNTKDWGTVINDVLNIRKDSIISRAKESVFQFPILISSSLTLDTVTMMTRSLERNYANYIRIAISNSDIINTDQGANSLSNTQGKREFLASIHQNNDDFYDNFRIGVNFGESYDISSENKYKNLRQNIHNESIRYLKPYCENYNESTLNDLSLTEATYTKETKKGRTTVTQTYVDDKLHPSVARQMMEYDKKLAALDKEADKLKSDREKLEKDKSDLTNSQNMDKLSKMQDQLTKQLDKIEEEKKKIIDEKNKIQDQLTKINLTNERDRLEREKAAGSNRITAELSDTEVRKNNEMEPTILNLTVQYKADGVMKDTAMLLGIKCIAHPIPTDEMTYFIPRSIMENRIFFKLIKWTTGEIKFWKDVVLNYDDIKFDASSKKESVRWWKYLSNKAQIKRFQAVVGGKNANSKQLIPNTTLVIKIEEAEYIKQKYGIDFLKKDKKYARKLMDIFFLLNFVIVDEVSELVYMFDDQKLNWELYSFQALKKENQKSTTSDIKALVSLLK